MNRFVIYTLFSFVLFSCSSVRYVEPLNKDELAVGFSYGGPVISYNETPIPLPLTSIDVGYGIDSSLTLHGGLHTTAAFFGNLQLDLGATYGILKPEQKRPGISISGSFSSIYSFEYIKLKIWPVIDMNAYWKYGNRNNLIYTGIHSMVELGKNPMSEEWGPKIVSGINLGHIFKSKLELFQFTTEFKFLAPYSYSEDAFIPYKSFTGNYGATGFYIGIRKLFKQ